MCVGMGDASGAFWCCSVLTYGRAMKQQAWQQDGGRVDVTVRFVTDTKKIGRKIAPSNKNVVFCTCGYSFVSFFLLFLLCVVWLTLGMGSTKETWKG